MTFPDYCANCGGPVVLPPATPTLAHTTNLPGMWRYAGRLPVTSDTAWLSMGEGGTPVVPAAAAAEWCGVERLMLKLDHLNPSGSFKDRATAVGVAQAVRQRARAVVCASSGNAAGSTAAYAARAGLPAVVLTPEAVPPGKAAIARAHGATVLRVRGDYSNTFRAARELADRFGWINLTTTYVNPVAVAGLKSAGYELADQLGDTPDWIVVPIGAGPLVHGIVTAYRELRDSGEVAALPRILGVQAEGCAPIADAFARDATEVVPWPEVRTRISAISDPLRGYPADGTYTLRLVRESNGVMATVSDTAAGEAVDQLAHREGLLIESGAAADLVAVRTQRARGTIGPDETVVCVLTGNGAKTLSAEAGPDDPVVADADEAIDHLGALPETAEGMTV
ncbi:threonine synthase [Spiractinospora alimapuensis]|uniref:threonine synthase n=1 Tax=Spiractinospora alimapuensis TaxID=2820884 RepID=UPI001F46E831|nr:threonine synthase [Spiractinospora alimapuensis]QVQ52289.1 threonine synthase [Spiractinospora alimapuensis]QVQ52307.1 threonine synthase [Spiractinospora alimapuensis]